MRSDDPALSVVVVVLAGGGQLARCLRALAAQEDPPPFEVIVPHDETLTEVDRLRVEFRWLTFLRSERRLTYAEHRARGCHHARADVIAFTEDHCIPGPGWCRAILAAHQNPHAAVGGPVDKAVPDTSLNWAVYLSDFSRYMSPVREGPAAYLTDCNVSYKRTALAAMADLWREEFHETTVNWALLARGETLWLTSSLAVQQQRALTLGAALRERYAFGRLFASTRVAATGTPRRALYLGGVPILPALLVARVVANVARTQRHIASFLRALPLIGLLATVWTWGELVGYATGRPSRSSRPP